MSCPFPLESLSTANAEADARALQEQANRLSQINSRFQIALDNMARGLSMFDADGRLIVCNALYRDIYGLPEELVQPGTPFSRILAYYAAKDGSANTADDLARQQAWLTAHARERQFGKVFTQTHELADGRAILVTVQPMEDGGWVDIQEDVTEKALTEERISWLAQHCPLTEIANRFHFRSRLDAAIQGLSGDGKVAVHLIDLDFFKQVNDTLGHAAGDAVLKAVAQRMLSTIRDCDLVGRIGGDEFAILQTNISGAEEAESLANRVVRTLNAPYRALGADAEIGASIGIALAPVHGTDADTLLRKADIALYRMKTAGRGNACLYTLEDEAAVIARMELRSALRDALANRQLVLHYQPIVDLKAGRVVGLEALMRWRHPTLGMVPPTTFIPIAEKTGLILAMGEWALNRACRDAVSWPSDLKVAVNLSAVEFDKGDLTVSVQKALDASGLDPQRLEIEITELALIKSEERTLETLRKLRSMGVRIVLDDFGSGVASLNNLRTFTFDKIKIDQSFVGEMTTRHDSKAIVGAVAGLAKTLGIGPVAEGVEELRQLEGVSFAGCEEMQGFYFSRPVPPAEVAAAVDQCASVLLRSGLSRRVV